eukprot:GHRQ01035517.1.p2 GENE.GHRQ01035517.1~~GHRQ01035517.1.p2  ORF type:complete len:106 (-),score=34.13 GHRQ01035517.1:53-370(-)
MQHRAPVLFYLLGNGLVASACFSQCPAAAAAPGLLLLHVLPASVASLALSQVLLKYNMQRGVVVIPKASSPEHLAENLRDMFSWRLNNQQKVSGPAIVAQRLQRA